MIVSNNPQPESNRCSRCGTPVEKMFGMATVGSFGGGFTVMCMQCPEKPYRTPEEQDYDKLKDGIRELIKDLDTRSSQALAARSDFTVTDHEYYDLMHEAVEMSSLASRLEEML